MGTRLREDIRNTVVWHKQLHRSLEGTDLLNYLDRNQGIRFGAFEFGQELFKDGNRWPYGRAEHLNHRYKPMAFCR